MATQEPLELIPTTPRGGQLTGGGSFHLPAIITDEGQKAGKRFLEFFTVNIRNLNTRQAYVRAISTFLEWCERHKLSLKEIEPMHVAAYVELLTKEREPQTVKQHLAAIRMLCDWLVVGQIMPFNPAASVKGPRYSYRKGKTPILSAADMRKLLDSIDVSAAIGLRDRALIALMFYSFGRVSALISMDVGDYFPRGKRFVIGLHEKGGKYHEVPVHHKAEEYLDAYIEAAGLAGQKKTPLFRSFKGKGKGQKMTESGIRRVDVWKMVRRRALEAGIREEISPHSFRGTGITVYLDQGGTLENAQEIANHSSARTTKLYDRTKDEISLDEIERIVI